MKTIEKYTNEVIDGFQNNRGNAYVYCFQPLTYVPAVTEIVDRLCRKWTDAKILIVVDRYEQRLKLTDFLKEHPTITCLSKDYINHRYMYNYTLVIFIDVKDKEVINYICYKFRLLVLTEDSMDNSFKTFINSQFKQINTTVTANSARTDLIYSPVEETQVSVSLFDSDYSKYKEYDEYITECMKVFGDLETIEKCKHGDIQNNISAIEFRDKLARQNGWSDSLDMSIGYLQEIDKFYNPNSLYEKACRFYNIRAEREKLILNYDLKIDKILDIIENNPDKKIIVVSKSGEFANKINKVINQRFGYISDCYHNEIEDRMAVDENNNPIRYKTGAQKGKIKVVKAQAISTINNRMFNDNKLRVLCIKNSSDVKLNCNCDIMILTSPLCDDIFTIKTRYNNLHFLSNPNKTYMIYCNNTIESKKLFDRKISSLMQIKNDDEKNLQYDEINGAIIL